MTANDKKKSKGKKHRATTGPKHATPRNTHPPATETGPEHSAPAPTCACGGTVEPATDRAPSTPPRSKPWWLKIRSRWFGVEATGAQVNVSVDVRVKGRAGVHLTKLVPNLNTAVGAAVTLGAATQLRISYAAPVVAGAALVVGLVVGLLSPDKVAKATWFSTISASVVAVAAGHTMSAIVLIPLTVIASVSEINKHHRHRGPKG